VKKGSKKRIDNSRKVSESQEGNNDNDEGKDANTRLFGIDQIDDDNSDEKQVRNRSNNF